MTTESSGVTMAVKVDEQYYRSLAEMLDALPERVVRYSVPGLTILYCNEAWAAGFRLDPSEVIGRCLDELLTPFEIVILRAHLALLSPQNPLITNGAHAPNSANQWVDWVDRFLPGVGGDGDEVLAVGRDATGRHIAELKLVDSEARFRELADRSADVVWRFYGDPIPHFDYLSPSIENTLGYKPEVFLKDFTKFLDILDAESQALVLSVIAGEWQPPRVDLRFRCADGHMVICETLSTFIRGGLQGISRDVTELRGLQDNLASLALRDPLTGLANRRLLDELLDQALARAQSSGLTLSVAFLDLDDFKSINDTYGHDAGDIVLCETARRLLGVVRSGDVIARLGGDEFVIVYEQDQAVGESLVSRIWAALSLPIAVSTTVSVRCPASIGLASTRSTGFDPTDLLAAADAAMYEDKNARRRAPHS